MTTTTMHNKDGGERENIFIIGSRRSGTTWTLSLLAGHPGIVGVIHTNIISAFRELDVWWNRDEQYHNSVLSGGEKTANLRDDISESEFFNSCRQVTDLVLNKAFDSEPQAKYVAESQPENIEYLELLGRLYPQAHIIHVVRDPRAVFASWKAAAKSWSSGKLFNTNPIRFCDRWRRENSTARSLKAESGLYREIQYEELKDEGIASLVDIFGWLGLDTNPKIAKDSIDANSLGNMRKREIMPQKFFRKGKTTGWKNELSKSEILCIEYLLAKEMAELGYSRLYPDQQKKPGMLRRYEFARYVYRRLSRILPTKFSESLQKLYIRS